MSVEEEKYLRAQRRVAKMKKFYKHLSSWMITSIFLMVLFFVLRMPPWITLVVVAGWGVGIAAEAIDVFGFPGMGRDWEERKIEEELSKMNHSDHSQEQRRERQSTDQDTLDLPELRKVEKNWEDSDLV